MFILELLVANEDSSEWKIYFSKKNYTEALKYAKVPVPPAINMRIFTNARQPRKRIKF